MGEFMNSYKRLDNLCRDMNGIGVTGYIEDMESTTNGDYYVLGWKDDYVLLKAYRHIRNQIAHENDMDEDSLCSIEDTTWLQTFYQRIMTQSDPLALYYQATKQDAACKNSAMKARQDRANHCNTDKPTKEPIAYETLIFLAVAIAFAAAAVFVFFKLFNH